MDPVITTTIVICMSLLFAISAIHKLRDPSAFQTAMDGYRLVPPALLGIAAKTLMASELIAAVMLLIPLTRSIGLGVVLALLSIYTLSISVNLLRGRRDIDCGCHGPASKQLLSWWLVSRNLVFAALVLVAMQPTPVRVLNWLDLLAILFAVMVASGLFLCINQILVQAPGLKRLRNSI
jgi:hypothetical protein